MTSSIGLIQSTSLYNELVRITIRLLLRDDVVEAGCGLHTIAVVGIGTLVYRIKVADLRVSET